MTKRKPSIVGNYKFTGKVLGKGNFARVEEAYHEILDVKVAVKIMDLDVIKEEYVIRNLLREARIMMKLSHPCIVSIFETMQRSDNIYYLVTEIVNGGDLCTYVKSQRAGKLDERSAKFFGQQFVSALSYMHQKGIVHRDLKMENVMLNTTQNQIKIVDFGLSNEWTADCPLKTHCGSPEYAAPELFVTSKVYGPEVDLWSLGIILYGMVVGQLPFIGSKAPSLTSQERRKLLVAQINRGISNTQRKALANFSTDFKNLMNRLLNADSKKRITIKEMLLHPWVTENGKKFVKINPSKKETSLIRNKILNEISTVSSISVTELNKNLKDRPLGKMGGMYNILSHGALIRPFHPDQLTRSLSKTVTNKVQQESASKKQNEERTSLLRPHTMSDNCQRSKTRTILSPQMVWHADDVVNSLKKSDSELLNRTTRNRRPRSALVNVRHHSVSSEEKRPLTSAFRKRQEYSAMVSSKWNSLMKENSRKNVGDEFKETLALQKRIEYLRRSIPQNPTQPRNILAREIMKTPMTDIDTPTRIPRPSSSPMRNKPTDHTCITRKTIEKPKLQTTSTSRPAALKKFSVPHCESIEKLLAENKPSKRSPKKSPKKTATSRTSDTEPKKSAGKVKSKLKRPTSCRSNIETNILPVKQKSSK